MEPLLAALALMLCVVLLLQSMRGDQLQHQNSVLRMENQMLRDEILMYADHDGAGCGVLMVAALAVGAVVVALLVQIVRYI
jgi:hypothetical protein